MKTEFAVALSAAMAIFAFWCVFLIGKDIGVIAYVKEDWCCRLPYRLRSMRFRGANAAAYSILCVLYYAAKSFLLLYFYAAFRFFKFVFWDIYVWVSGRKR